MKYILLLSILLTLSTSSFSQDINSDPFNNRVVLKHYSVKELNAAKENDYRKFKWIKYYYIQSFIIDESTLSNCPSFDTQLFDVSDYETYRVKERRITFTTPCGVTITLLSERELDLLIIHDGIIPAPESTETK